LAESEAIERLRRGDIGGLEALVRRYQGPALKAALIICDDFALAEDVVQGAFLRAYERIEQFDPARPFGPWFLRAVVNDTLKALRRPHLSLDGAIGSDSPRLAAADVELEAILGADTREAVWAALERLTPEQRAVVVLRYSLDLSAAEVAARLERPPGTIRRHLHEARARLRGLLPAWMQSAGQE
jgi:RNA polymerase sigma-70 factor (ECF subfamily)